MRNRDDEPPKSGGNGRRKTAAALRAEIHLLTLDLPRASLLRLKRWVNMERENMSRTRQEPR